LVSSNFSLTYIVPTFDIKRWLIIKKGERSVNEKPSIKEEETTQLQKEKEQTMIYKTLERELNIKQHKHH
jgi:hypothetical protein